MQKEKPRMSECVREQLCGCVCAWLSESERTGDNKCLR